MRVAHRPGDVTDATMKLLLAPGVGPATLRKLRAHFNDDDRIVGATARELMQIDGIGRQTADALHRAFDEGDPQVERDLMEQHGTAIVLHDDEDYPPLLASIPDPPCALWLRGRMDHRAQPALAIVGSRKCTSYGREQAGRFASLLADCGFCIVSGGAIGIDSEAHRGALRVHGRTVAVMGCGLSRTYPPQNAELFDRIIGEGGALVSEYPMAVEPKAEHFPRRNRIISGLSVGVLVVEAAQRSGALITARKAVEEHGREVMALPGRVDSPASAGCLGAIRDGWAALVTSHADVLAQLESSPHLVRGALEVSVRAGGGDEGDPAGDAMLNEPQRKIVDVLRDAGAILRAEDIARRCGLPMSAVMAELTMLELRGRLRRDHRGVELRR